MAETTSSRLIYLMNVSLDGYVEDRDHGLDWSTVDEEIHAWFNEQLRRSSAQLYGRRLYETMTYWGTAESDPELKDVERDFARAWLATPKVVFSSTLQSVDWNSRLVRGDPIEMLDELRQTYPGELSVAGPTLASAFVERDLVDEYRLMVHPVILGGGTPFFPHLERPLDLELVEERRFASGVVLLAYRRRSSRP
jgi:dihydrofolate reductase